MAQRIEAAETQSTQLKATGSTPVMNAQANSEEEPNWQARNVYKMRGEESSRKRLSTQRCEMLQVS